MTELNSTETPLQSFIDDPIQIDVALSSAYHDWNGYSGFVYHN